MDQTLVQNIVEAALVAAGKPLSIKDFAILFDHESQPPSRAAIKLALSSLQVLYQDRGVELVEVASGYRLQARAVFAPWVARLWEDKPPRYSRAMLETLALIAYRQPVTRGDIEQVRGVAVSSHIVRTLLERGWIRVIGHKEVPGRPALYATTNTFLDYFNLSSLDQLPALSNITDLESLMSPAEAPQAATTDQPAETSDSIDSDRASKSELMSSGEEI